MRKLLCQNEHLIIPGDHSPWLICNVLFSIVQSENISDNRLIVDFKPKSMQEDSLVAICKLSAQIQLVIDDRVEKILSQLASYLMLSARQ